MAVSWAPARRNVCQSVSAAKDTVFKSSPHLGRIKLHHPATLKDCDLVVVHPKIFSSSSAVAHIPHRWAWEKIRCSGTIRKRFLFELFWPWSWWTMSTQGQGNVWIRWAIVMIVQLKSDLMTSRFTQATQDETHWKHRMHPQSYYYARNATVCRIWGNLKRNLRVRVTKSIG